MTNAVPSDKPTTDLEWFASNPPELDQHKGKYVAIYKQQIIGSGDTVKEASSKARERVKDADLLIAYIEENNFIALTTSYSRYEEVLERRKAEIIERIRVESV